MKLNLENSVMSAVLEPIRHAGWECWRGEKWGNIPRRNTLAKGSRAWKIFVPLENGKRIPRKAYAVSWRGSRSDIHPPHPQVRILNTPDR